MDTDGVAAVRRFNRTVTERIGALDNAYLSRSRPLGQSRILWEIGTEAHLDLDLDPDPGGQGAIGIDVKRIRSRLGLDSGYLSRLLRALEADGLIEMGRNPDDARVRTARLTEAGVRERALLDEGSDELAQSLLAPLNPRQQQQLVSAMNTVERLLTAGLVAIAVEDPASADARFCIDRYFEELDHRFDTGFDPDISISADADELRPPRGLLLVARLRDRAIGCGALKLHGTDPAEIKRMWVGPDARGLGLGRRLLETLERHAAQHGATAVRLETNGSLVEAISLYRSAGYLERPAFNDEPFAHHWFEKPLDSDAGR